jgi:phenylalanyl-tRNA synthetase beta chain
VKIVLSWLAELVDVPRDVNRVASEISLRGFEVADLDGDVIDFEVTANRPDCLSHLGFAREAAVIWDTPVKPLPLVDLATTGESAIAVDVQDGGLCPRYCAQIFDVTVGPSPSWLVERLAAAGVRAINGIVDVTNYVMLELGQPMHAFDLDRLAGRRLVIRRARDGERLRTLDGIDRALEDGMLVIADAERASAIGGVMGGSDSEIGPGTTRMVLESACFQPASVRRTSKRLGLKTEASTRFERGADVHAAPVAIARAAALIERIGAGRAAGPLVDRYASPRAAIGVTLRESRIARLLGQRVPAADVPRVLEPLGFRVSPDASRNDARWSVTVPSFRVDVTREADLIEEVGRHYGFDRLPATFPPLSVPQRPPDPAIARERTVRQVLAAAGFSESMTFAFVEREAALPFCTPGTDPAAIANPLSEKYAVLRPSLLPGLIDSCGHNRRRARKDIRLYESGSRFTTSGEGRAAAFAWCGSAEGPHWSAGARAVDFFDAKGVAERICAAFGVAPTFTPADVPFLVPGRAAELHARAHGATIPLGVVGQIAPAVAEAREFPPSEAIYAGEIDLTALASVARGDDLRAESLPRYPSIVRDISILVDEALPAAAVRGTIRSAAPDTLVAMVEFDRYKGKGVPEGRISLSMRLTFRAPDRTLTDDEVQSATERIVSALRAEHGAEQR